MEQLKLLSMTAVLTVLIWVTADNLVNETVTIPVSIEVTAAAGSNDMVVSTERRSTPFAIQVVGPRKTVAQAQARSPLTIRVAVPEQTTGVASLSLLDLIRDQWQEFRRLTVLSVNPPSLEITVDHLRQYELPIHVREQLSLTYDARPQHHPTAVQVKMRETRFRELAVSDRLPPLDITADVERILRDQTPGQSVTVSVPLDGRNYGSEARLTPRSVEVTAALTSMRRTAEIPTVPILLAVSFANLAKPLRAVTADGSDVVTQTIRVTGPVEDVARLIRGESRAFGLIQLKSDQFEEIGVVRPMTPEFILPQGIELVDKARPIEIKLVSILETPGKGDLKPTESASEGNRTP